MKGWMVMAAVLPMAALHSGCVRADVIETRDLAWPALDGQVLSVSTFNGDIVIHAGGGDSIRATATINSTLGITDAEKVEISFTPGLTASLVARRPADFSDSGVSFEITIPGGVALGSLESSNGEIILDSLGGDPVIDTSNGDVALEGFRGTVRIDTSNGDVTADGPSVVVDRIDTSNGDIVITAAGFLPGASLDTSNGNVTITLAGRCAASFELDTSNGGIDLSGPGFSGVSLDDEEGSASFGANGPIVTVSTSNGSITVISPGE